MGHAGFDPPPGPRLFSDRVFDWRSRSRSIEAPLLPAAVGTAAARRRARALEDLDGRRAEGTPASYDEPLDGGFDPILDARRRPFHANDSS